VTRKMILLSASMLLAGCAGTAHTPLSTSQADQIAGKSLAVVTHEKPSFSAATPTKAMFGAFGAMAMISEGNAIVTANAIEDPSIDIGDEIAASLTTRYDLSASAGPDISATDEVDELARQYAAADLVLFTQTRGWGFMYFPGDWDNYRVNLNMTVRLIDTERRSVLAAADCIYTPEYDDSDQAPTHDDLMSDNAAGLKAELKKGADYCIEKLLSETFT
jgi:hypothetical protein